MSKAEVFEKVRGVLLRILASGGIEEEDIAPDSSLIEDLGMESMLFVDLQVGLEEVLGLTDFRIDEWADDQIENEERFLVDSLVERCLADMT